MKISKFGFFKAISSARSLLTTLILLTLGSTPNVYAIPAFSQQTGMSCEACHVGAFGPQLTPFGRQFKLMGYTMKTPGTGFSPKISFQVLESFLRTQKDQPRPAAPGFNTNDNWELQTIGIYLAGPITDHLGLLAQASYAQNGHTLGWDSTDIRYARTTDIGSHSAIWGISLNNAPTLSDIYNSTPAWQYPFEGPDLAPGAPATPMIMGTFANGVLGVTAYTQIDTKWYIEAGGYQTPSQRFLNQVNGNYFGRLTRTAPYLRLAYQTNLTPHSNLEIGGLYFAPNLQPMGLGAGSDNYRDYGVDASYEWLANSTFSFTAQGLYVHEAQTLNNTFAAGGASNLHNHLNAINLNASGWYENTYGLTLGALTNDGSSDTQLYGGSPNTDGGIVELTWVPFGKQTSWNQPFVNLRVGLQYNFYTKFAGLTSNASDNNATYLYFQAFF